MSLPITEKKLPSQKDKSKILSQLDTFDKDFPANPGRFSTTEELNEKSKSLFEKALQNKNFKAGQVVEGQILQIMEDHIVVDIQYKSEGIIPRSEFRGEDQLEIGKKVDVYIEQVEDKNGMVVLSKDKANIKKILQDIIHAKENDETIQGKVTAVVKGGVSVDIGIKAFLPGSQADIRHVRRLDSLVGQTLDFKIIKMNYKRGNIVLSRRALLEKEREKLTSTDIKEGAIVKGIVKNITDYGAFVDLGDRDGLLHITDMSWSRIERPNQLVQVGQELNLKILKIDREKNRISLGLKQLNEKKWESTISKYEIGAVVKGKVSSIVDYGAFVLLEDGLEGLVHVGELSWSRKVKHPSHILKIDEELEVKIIDIKKDSRKLSLSLKRAGENPWESLKNQFSVGDVGEFEVVSVSDFGFFVKVNDTIDGLVRVSDISWTENINHFEKYKAGDKVKAKILDIDPEGERFSLGIKQLSANPWALLEEKYPIGSRHEVEITRVVDFGAFVQIQDEIEGLIHVSELSKKRVDKPQEVVKAGDKVTAEILSIDKNAKKINLSVRLVESSLEGGQASTSEESPSKPSPNFMEGLLAKALKKSVRTKNPPEEKKK